MNSVPQRFFIKGLPVQPKLIGISQTIADLKHKRYRASDSSKTNAVTLKWALNHYVMPLAKKFPFKSGELTGIIHIFWKISQGQMMLSDEAYHHFLSSSFNLKRNGPCRLRSYARLNNPNKVFLNEFAYNLWVIMRGRTEERARFAFEVYDNNGKGYLTRDDLEFFMNWVLPGRGHDENKFSDGDQDRIFIDFLMKKLWDQSTLRVTREKFFKFVKENPHATECLMVPIWPEEKYVRLWKNLILT